MDAVGVGAIVAGGIAGVEISAVGLRAARLGIAVNVTATAGTGVAVPQAANRAARMIVYNAFSVGFIPTLREKLNCR